MYVLHDLDITSLAGGKTAPSSSFAPLNDLFLKRPAVPARAYCFPLTEEHLLGHCDEARSAEGDFDSKLEDLSIAVSIQETHFQPPFPPERPSFDHITEFLQDASSIL